MAGSRIFTIEPNPHWVIIDDFSNLPDGAAIYTYRSLDPSVFKPAFQDAAGTVPYGQPIVGFGNGTMPPIFWEFDPLNPTDTYYIRVYDSADPTTQNFLWDFNGLSGGGSGGGGTVVTATNLENLVVNNIFFRNIGQQLGSPSLPTFLTIAPSNNAGFVGNAGVLGNGSPAPDITFQKNNTANSDSLDFILFTPLGINSLSGDVTPELYVRYICSTNIAGETYKYIQFPISKGVQSLSQQTVTVKIYARCNSGDPTLILNWKQFYGDGGGSGEQIVQVGAPITLTSSWTPYIISSQVPDATGQTIGACRNDSLFLQVSFPLDLATSIDFIKPAIYLGNVAPGTDFVSNDEVDSLVNSPRTGDIRTSLNNFVPGWVIMNDGTIGDAASGSTARANVDTYPLFNLIWNTFVGNQALAPMFTNAGVGPIPYGATPISDFIADRRLSLTRNLGRVMAGALPAPIQQAFTSAANVITVASTASFFTGVPVVLTGGGLPPQLIAGVTYYAIQGSATTLLLAETPENAIAAIPLIFGAGAGTITVPAHQLGFYLGQETHVLTRTELPDPLTTTALTFPSPGFGTGVIQSGSAYGGGIVSNSGGNQPHNIMQPTVFMNVFIKL